MIVVSAMLIKPMAVLGSGSKKPIFHWGLCDEPKGLERSRQNAEGVDARKESCAKGIYLDFSERLPQLLLGLIRLLISIC